MTDMTDFLEDALNNLLWQATAFPISDAGYLALGTSATVPQEDGTGFTEVSGGAYVRVQLTAGVTAGSSAGTITNGAGVITWPEATANWGTLRYVALFTTATLGSMIAFKRLAADVTVNTGQTFRFNTNALTFVMS
jgi:hypothetical protein